MKEEDHQGRGCVDIFIRSMSPRSIFLWVGSEINGSIDMDTLQSHGTLLELMHSLRIYQIAVGFCLALFVIGSFAFALYQKYLENKLVFGEETNEAMNFYGQTFGIAYGILIGLTAIACWDNFNAVEDIISQETAAIGTFHRLSWGIKNHSTEGLRETNLRYLDSIVEDDWPASAHGQRCDGGLLFLEEVRTNLYKIVPSNSAEQMIYGKMLDSFSDMIKFRQLRVNSAMDLGVPDYFWVVILAGGALTIVLMLFVQLESLMIRYFMLGVYSIMLGLMYFLIAVIDDPFRGEAHVSPSPYIHLKAELKEGL
jgi:Protein of unknown function (DUF4239)